MREIILDTETTGLDPYKGNNRLVEIGAIELINHLPTGKTYHQYINPERSMPEAAYNVHGLSEEFLSDKPVFKDVAIDFLSFIGDATLVIHNADFDMKFINAELEWASLAPLPMERALCTLQMARSKFPGAPASLDSLCRRFEVDNSNRQLHGALLDSELLADVYMGLLGGRQIGFDLAKQKAASSAETSEKHDASHKNTPRVARDLGAPSAEELAAHEEHLTQLKATPFWHTFRA